MTRATVDAYVEAIKSEITNREDSLLLSIHNYAKLGGLISPYFLGRLKEFSDPENSRDDFHGRVALVNSSTAFQLLFDSILRIFSRNSDVVTIRFFTDVESAVKWVSEYEAT